MFETQKIDTFFSGEKNLLDEEEKIFVSRRTKVVRFLKLFLPCLVAVLLGLGIALFDFEANSESMLQTAEEEKMYFEKFRIKNTVFEIIDKNNKLSTLKADIVEETVSGTKIYDLTHPDAQTIDKGKIITLAADSGVYDQTKQVLDLKDNVVSDYNKVMKIKTSRATYNFDTEYGYGHEKVIGNGEKGYFEADRFTFDRKTNIVTLIGNVYMKNDSTELKTPHTAVLRLDENKFTAVNAQVTKGKDILKTDELIVFFKDGGHFEIDKAYSNGHTEIYSEGKAAFADRGEYYETTGLVKLFENVRIVDSSGYTATANEGVYDKTKNVFTLTKNVIVKDKSGYTATAGNGIYDLNKKTFTLIQDVRIDKGANVITAPKAIYFQAKDEFRFYDDVKVVQEDGTATAKNGVYYIKKNIAELHNNVVITRNGNTVYGEKAVSDFTTSQSRLVGKEGGRIFGKLIESTLKKNSKEK